MRHLRSLFDCTADDVRDILTLSKELKSETAAGTRQPRLAGCVLGQIFDKPSLRTRGSFEAAMTQLGGGSLFFTGKQIGLDGRESLEDVARVYGGYADVIAIRTFEQAMVDTFAELAGVPIINALTDEFHPCQALTDLLTIEEHFGTLEGRTLAYVGDGNNVAVSLAIACGLAGVRMTLAAPDGYLIPEATIDRVRSHAPQLDLMQTADKNAAVAEADAIYTDVWASMGQESEKQLRAEAFADYQIDSALVAAAPEEAIVLHCLPARRGLEITDEVMEHERSLVFPQAENRMHLAKGLICWLLGR